MEDRATPKTVCQFSSTILGKEKKEKSQKLKPVEVMIKTYLTTAKVMETSKKPVKYWSTL